MTDVYAVHMNTTTRPAATIRQHARTNGFTFSDDSFMTYGELRKSYRLATSDYSNKSNKWLAKWYAAANELSIIL